MVLSDTRFELDVIVIIYLFEYSGVVPKQAIGRWRIIVTCLGTLERNEHDNSVMKIRRKLIMGQFHSYLSSSKIRECHLAGMTNFSCDDECENSHSTIQAKQMNFVRTCVYSLSPTHKLFFDLHTASALIFGCVQCAKRALPLNTHD
jgi:hypothetical protein